MTILRIKGTVYMYLLHKDPFTICKLFVREHSNGFQFEKNAIYFISGNGYSIPVILLRLNRIT